MNDDLLQVLYDTQKYLARSDADFAWSSWKDHEAALNEVDLLIERVRRGRFPKRTLDVLFLPTGSIQGVSLAAAGAMSSLLWQIDMTKLSYVP